MMAPMNSVVMPQGYVTLGYRRRWGTIYLGVFGMLSSCRFYFQFLMLCHNPIALGDWRLVPAFWAQLVYLANTGLLHKPGTCGSIDPTYHNQTNQPPEHVRAVQSR